MKKILLYSVFILLSAVCLSWAADALFKDMEISPGANLKNYDAVYIDAVDAKDVDFDVFDSYESDTHSVDNPSDAQRRNGLKMEIRQRFGMAISKVMPVLNDKKAATGKKVLLLNIKILGTVKDEGLLDSFIKGKTTQNTDIVFSCQIYDLSSNEKLATIADTYSKEITKEGVSTLASSDLNDWYKAIDAWAANMAEFLAQQK